MDPSLPQFDFNSTHKDTQPILEKTFEDFMQPSKRVLNDDVQLLARLDRLASELASEQEKDSFLLNLFLI